MLELEILIVELGPVDALAPSAIPTGEIAALYRWWAKSWVFGREKTFFFNVFLKYVLKKKKCVFFVCLFCMFAFFDLVLVLAVIVAVVFRTCILCI